MSRAGQVVERGLTCRHPGEPGIGVSSRPAKAHMRGPYGGGHCEDWTSETATGRECGRRATATATGDSEGSRHRQDGQHVLAVRAPKLAFCLLQSTESLVPLRPSHYVNWNASLWKDSVPLALRCLPNPPSCPAPASRPQRPASDTFPRPYDQMVL